ncbi:MAG: efflux RND transporter periplasmic adaptor subunit [Chloroflexi bacterium]|nr:efflux RND transporter periplasmic adaptor subunit [Anaerolineaceae bacterium]NMB88474.1 efflux RND transporter periplasmic adaptor subunit [Chloroflexota bacterium]
MNRKRIIIISIVLIAAVGVFLFFSLRNPREAAQSNYQTAAIERGELIGLVGATGTVRANQSTVLSWQTTGQIETITVELGDQIADGQLLATLKKSSLPQSVILAEADLVTAKRNLEDLKTSGVDRANAQLALVQAQDAYDDAVEKRESKEYERSAQTTIDIARANLIIAENGVTQAEINYDRFDGLGEDNPMRAEAFSQLASANQTRDRAQANLNWLLGKPDAQEVALADANVEVARANLDAAQREWERLKDGPDPNDVAAAEARVAAIEATLAMSQLEAPINGTITGLDSLVGDQVTAGTQTFRIDDLSRLLVDVEVPEVDINRVQVGQAVRLTFDAVLNKEYTGKVSEVSKVGVSNQGLVNFVVTVEVDDADAEVLPGMTAAVNVVVNQLEDVLLVPNRAVRNRDGNQVIYVLKGGLPQPVDVTIGASSETQSEIASGDVKEGDLVVLNPPSDMVTGAVMR